MRSLLTIRATDDGALDQALAAGADALVIELCDAEAVSTARTRDVARTFLDRVLCEEVRPLVFVRVAGIAAETVDADLEALVPCEPDGIVLGACGAGRDLQQLGARLAVIEAEHDIAAGQTAVIAEAGHLARAVFALGGYRGASERLLALSWDAESLAVDLGSELALAPDAGLPFPLAQGRAMTLLGARAAEVAAIEGVCRTADSETLRAVCEAARRDGFNAMMAGSADQVAIINAVFDRDM